MKPGLMYDRFTVEIELGNEGMQAGPHVAAALRTIADKIDDDLQAEGVVVDVNGNTVGKWGPSND